MNRKFITCSIFSGLLGGVVMLVANLLQLSGVITPDAGLTFVAFIAWTCYFLAGSSPKDAVHAWLSFVVGIICAVLIFVIADALTAIGVNVTYLGLPIAVAIGVILMCFAEKLPIANRVPYIYLGAATFFGMMNIPVVAEKGFLIVGLGELLYVALGFLAGFINVKLTNLVESRITEANALAKDSE